MLYVQLCMGARECLRQTWLFLETYCILLWNWFFGLPPPHRMRTERQANTTFAAVEAVRAVPYRPTRKVFFYIIFFEFFLIYIFFNSPSSASSTLIRTGNFTSFFLRLCVVCECSRERLLIAIIFVILVSVKIWLLVLFPLNGWPAYQCARCICISFFIE